MNLCKWSVSFGNPESAAAAVKAVDGIRAVSTVTIPTRPRGDHATLENSSARGCLLG